MASTEAAQVEVERKFTFDEGRSLDLSTIRGVVAVREGPVETLRATYFDTSDLRLTRRGLELRRRTGEGDSGWHLKVPAGADQKLEIRAPLGATVTPVPERFEDQLLGVTRGRPLVPVAQIDTHRRDGPRKFLQRASKAFRKAGADPSTWWSKVGRLLDQPRAEASSSPPHTAGEVALRYLRRHVDALMEWDTGVRTDRADAIHKMRVATRRLRSTMATFRRLLDGEHWESARRDLAGENGFTFGLLSRAEQARAVAADAQYRTLCGVSDRQDDQPGWH